MATHVFLHIGGPKTGTTYLQSILWHNRDLLRADGVLYPGDDFLFHHRATLDLRQERFAGYANPEVPGTWRRLVDEARQWAGTVIISHEMLSPARPEDIDRAIADLGFAELHVVYTARDLVRQVPAMWQQNLRNGDTQPFEEFLACIRTPGDEAGEAFWSYQDAAGVLARWTRNLPAERAHLITVPQPGAPRDLLWRRFCRVVGIDPMSCATDEAIGHDSLGIVETDLLRRINLALGGQVRWPVYATAVNVLLASQVLSGRPGQQKMVLSGPERIWAADRSAELARELRKHDYDIVGDLDELIPGEPAPVRPGKTGASEELTAAVECVAALVRRLQEQRAAFEDLAVDRDGLHAERDRLRDEGSAVRAERDRLRAERDHLAAELGALLATPPTKLYVRRLSEKNRAVMRARIVYWNVVEWLRRRSHARSKVSDQRSGDTSAGSSAR